MLLKLSISDKKNNTTSNTILSDELINRIKTATKKSNKLGVEIGFIICNCNGKLVPSEDEVEGDCYSIDKNELFSLKCNSKCERYGYFHTHPNGYPKPTSMDIIIGVRELCYVICVGGKDEARCYKMPDDIVDMFKKARELGKKIESASKNERDIFERKWWEVYSLAERKIKEFAEAFERDDPFYFEKHYKGYNKHIFKIKIV